MSAGYEVSQFARCDSLAFALVAHLAHFLFRPLSFLNLCSSWGSPFSQNWTLSDVQQTGLAATKCAAHLFQVAVPMLFLQGSKDKLAEITLLEPLLHKLGPRAALHIAVDADHSFHVPARSGRRDADVMAEILDAVAGWLGKLIAA